MTRNLRRRARPIVAAAAFLMILASVIFWSQAAESVPVSQLARETHMHGLAVDMNDPAFLLIATHHGLFRAGPAPAKLIDLAVSAQSPSTLYAATQSGLLVSNDAGTSWNPILQGPPASLVEVTPQGFVYAFVLGRGLLRSAEQPLDFSTLSSDWGDRIPLHLAVDPTDPERVFAATQEGRILASTDHGPSRTLFGK